MNETNKNEHWIKAIMERVEKLESRVTFLENAVCAKKPVETVGESEGISGGLTKLVRDGFFNTPKSLRQVLDELKRLGYYYQTPAVNTAITRDFMKRKGILTRLGKRGKWRYVIKK